MDALSLLAGFAGGVIWSEIGRRVLSQQQRPLRLVSTHAMVAPVIVADEAVDSQWRTAVVRFAVAAELAGSLSLNDMKRATTISRPAWYLYLSVLRQGGVVETAQDRTRTTWAQEFWARSGGSPARHLRQMIRHAGLSLPYPTRRPPTFLFRDPDAQMAQADTESTDDTGSAE